MVLENYSPFFTMKFKKCNFHSFDGNMLSMFSPHKYADFNCCWCSSFSFQETQSTSTFCPSIEITYLNRAPFVLVLQQIIVNSKCTLLINSSVTLLKTHEPFYRFQGTSNDFGLRIITRLSCFRHWFTLLPV